MIQITFIPSTLFIGASISLLLSCLSYLKCVLCILSSIDPILTLLDIISFLILFLLTWLHIYHDIVILIMLIFTCISVLIAQLFMPYTKLISHSYDKNFFNFKEILQLHRKLEALNYFNYLTLILFVTSSIFLFCFLISLNNCFVISKLNLFLKWLDLQLSLSYHPYFYSF